MYNNSQMTKVELIKLNKELEQVEITYKKLSELDESKKVFCSYGRVYIVLYHLLGTMYMTQSHESASTQLKEKMDKLKQKIESVKVRILHGYCTLLLETKPVLREAL